MRRLAFFALPLLLACDQKPVSNRIKSLATGASAGDTTAAYNLAVEYYRGDTLGRDYSKAAQLWHEAMLNGDATAMNNYAYLLFNGMGVATNKKEAVRLWHEAALKGVPESHSHLGYASLVGEGTTQDSLEAVARLRAAILLGEKSDDSVDKVVVADARALLDRLSPLSPYLASKGGELAMQYVRESTPRRTH